jgi:hypothetical protein
LTYFRGFSIFFFFPKEVKAESDDGDYKHESKDIVVGVENSANAIGRKRRATVGNTNAKSYSYNDSESDDDELFQAQSEVKVFPTESESKSKPTSRSVGKKNAKSCMDILSSDDSDDCEPFQSKASTVGDERKPSAFGMDRCDDSDKSDDDKPPSSGSKLKPRVVGKNKAPKSYMDFESSDESDDGEHFQSKASVVGDERKPRAFGMDSYDSDESGDGKPPSKTKFKSTVDLTGDSDLDRKPKARRSVTKKTVISRASSMMDIDSDEIGDEESSDDEPSNHRRRKSFATLEQEAWLGKDGEFSESEDDTEDELSADEEYHRSELAETNTSGSVSSRRLMGSCPSSPPSLSSDQKNEIVDSIDEPKDKALQRLLLGAGFQFTLMPHQFVAVRKIAGVSEDFPSHQGSKIVSPKYATMTLALEGLDYQANNQTNKGILIADEMVRVLCAINLS